MPGVHGRCSLDSAIARGSILNVCRRLRVGREARVDRNVLRSAFPLGRDSRPFDVQLSELLTHAKDGIFGCWRLADGDHVVRREVRKELVPEIQFDGPLMTST